MGRHQRIFALLYIPCQHCVSKKKTRNRTFFLLVSKFDFEMWDFLLFPKQFLKHHLRIHIWYQHWWSHEFLHLLYPKIKVWCQKYRIGKFMFSMHFDLRSFMIFYDNYIFVTLSLFSIKTINYKQKFMESFYQHKKVSSTKLQQTFLCLPKLL